MVCYSVMNKKLISPLTLLLYEKYILLSLHVVFDRRQLTMIYDHIQQVDPLDSHDAAHLALLARPELGITFSKIHCWTLTQYTKCVFLDADCLVGVIAMAKVICVFVSLWFVILSVCLSVCTLQVLIQ